MRRPFSLKKRGKYWYVKSAGEETYHSTGLADRSRAEGFALQEVQNHTDTARNTGGKTFGVYARVFFDRNTCRWVARQRAKKRSFTEAVAASRRGHLLNHILPQFGGRKLDDITAEEIED